MKIKLLAVVAVISLSLSGRVALAEETGGAATELKELVSKIEARLKEGKKTEADLASEIKEFDALLAKHKGEKTDDVANILNMEAMLYLQVFDNTDKGIELIRQVKSDYPETKPGKSADAMIESIKQQEEGKKVQRSLAEGKPFPDFSEKDVAGKPLSIANYKGKVVLIDFWATWCRPCVGELPNVIKTYDKHHTKGFEI